MKKIFLLILPIILYAQVIDTIIPLPGRPGSELFYVPEGSKLYMHLTLDYTRPILVLECSTYTIRRIIPIPSDYTGFTHSIWNWRRNKIYHTFNIYPDSIAVIDGYTDSIIKWINFQAYQAQPLCYHSKDDKVYATDGHSVAVIDCQTDSIIKIITQPYLLSGFVLWDSIGNKVYCGSSWDDKVTVINCANDSVVAVISSNVTFPSCAVYNPQRRKIYVGSERSSRCVVIDAISDTLIKNLPIRLNLFQLAPIFNSLEDKVYWFTDNPIFVIHIIDCLADSVIKSIDVGTIFGMNLAAWSNRLYFTTQGGDTTGRVISWLNVLDCHNDSLISKVRFETSFFGMTINSRDCRIYVGSSGDSSLYVFRDEIPGIEERTMLDAERLTPEIYPNPAKNVIRVCVPWASFTPNASRPTLKIFDVSGKLIREIASPPKADRNDRKIEISLKGINPGIYFLQLGSILQKFLVVR